MGKETEKILQSTPFNTYSDLFSAVFNNKASIRLSNGACRQIAEIQKPILANFGVHFGFIPSAVITVAFAIASTNYYLLLLLFLELVFPFAIYFLNNLKIKTGFIAVVLVLCDLFFFELPLFILIAALSWMISSWLVNWWVKKIYTLSVRILQYNEDAFEWAYNSHNLFIEDCYGNIYSKLKQTQSETEAYTRLLKILKIAVGTEDIDDVITVFSDFYLKKGIAIPSELYQDVAHCSKQKKHENLLKILELGTGVTGIENVTRRLIDFYTANGIVFPADIL